MKKIYLSFILLSLCTIDITAQETKLNKEEQCSELLKNPSFEEEAKPIRNRRFGPNGEGELFGGYPPAGIIPGWIYPDGKRELSTFEISTEGLLDTTQHKALRWEITLATSTTPAAIANVGVHGIKVSEGNKYRLTFWARADKKYKGKLFVGLQSKDDETWNTYSKVRGKIKKRWKKHTITFTAKGNTPKARFVMMGTKPGTIYLDCTSLTIAD